MVTFDAFKYGTLDATKCVIDDTCPDSSTLPGINLIITEAEVKPLFLTNTDCFGVAICTLEFSIFLIPEMVRLNSVSKAC